MRKHLKIICYSFLLFILLLLIACSDNTNEGNNNDIATDETSENTDTAEDDNVTDENESQDKTTTDESSKNNSDDQPSEESDISENNTTEEVKDESPSEVQDTENHNALSSYSSEEIEYARVWLQLGPNQDIDELYVEHIPAGTPLDPNDDENDISYPEDVIQISGSRIADGMVTYSGNGDGTINVYDIPYGNRWYGGMPRPDDIDLEEVQEEMRGIIENTESVSIEPGDDKEVKNLIEKIYMID